MKLNLEQWRELAQPYYEVVPREAPDKAGVFAEVKPIDQLLTTKLIAPKQLLVHEPSLRKATCHEYLLFERFYSGQGRGEIAESAFSVNPQKLHLIDMSQRFVTSKGHSVSRGVLIPHAAVDFTPGEDLAYSSVDIGSPEGSVMSAAHRALLTAKQDGSAASISVLSAVFLDLISRLMLRREKHRSEELEAAVSRGIVLREFVERNLHRSDLDADLLVSKFRISRTTLYRHFEREGGVTQYIKNRRLDRCFFELAGARARRGLIKGVAANWQFEDSSHFNRLFRDRFAMSPSECLAHNHTSRHAAPPELLGMSEAWLSQLGE